MFLFQLVRWFVRRNDAYHDSTLSKKNIANPPELRFSYNLQKWRSVLNHCVNTCAQGYRNLHSRWRTLPLKSVRRMCTSTSSSRRRTLLATRGSKRIPVFHSTAIVQQCALQYETDEQRRAQPTMTGETVPLTHFSVSLEIFPKFENKEMWNYLLQHLNISVAASMPRSTTGACLNAFQKLTSATNSWKIKPRILHQK